MGKRSLNDLSSMVSRVLSGKALYSLLGIVLRLGFLAGTKRFYLSSKQSLLGWYSDYLTKHTGRMGIPKEGRVMEPAVSGALAGLVGSVLLTLLNWWLNRSGRQLATKQDLRADVALLRTEVDSQRKEINELKEKNTWWEGKYEQLKVDSDERYRALNLNWERKYRALEAKHDALKDEFEEYKKEQGGSS